MAYNVLSKVYDVKLLCTGLYFDIMPYAGSYYHPEEGPLYGYLAGWEMAKDLQGYTGYFFLSRSITDYFLSYPI